MALGYNIVNKPPKEMPSHISKILRETILKMLEKNPTQRPNIKEVSVLFRGQHEKLKKNIWDLESSHLDFKEFLRAPIQKFEIKNEKLL